MKANKPLYLFIFNYWVIILLDVTLTTLVVNVTSFMGYPLALAITLNGACDKYHSSRVISKIL